MKIKGVDKFLKKLPALSGKKIVIIPILIISWFIFAFSILYQIDIYPLGDDSALGGYAPIIGVLIFQVISHFFVFQVWYWREYLIKKDKATSYQKIIFIGLMGIFSLISLAIHNFTSFFTFQTSAWKQSSHSFLSNSLIQLYLNNSFGLMLDTILKIGGILLFIIGFFLILRALDTFGFDYMAVVYLYFPEESEIQSSKIYSVLRHPTYAGLIYMSFSGFLLQFSIYSLFFFLIFVAGFYYHIVYLEDPELIERFGEGFKEYRKNTRAVLVRFKHLPIFFKFLFGREKTEPKSENSAEDKKNNDVL